MIWIINRLIASFERPILKTINEHQKSYDPENIRDLTDALLKATSYLDETEKQTHDLEKRLLIAMPQEFLGTGIEPHFSILRWALLNAIAHPEMQAELQQEVDKVVGRERPVLYEDRKKLPFTEAFIQETLRHRPPNPIALPHATTKDTTLNGYFIPENTMVFLNLYSLTRDERYWEEPEQFNPHRFLNASGEIRDDLLEKHYPFGIGKRRCFGEYLGRLETFMVFTNLMQRYTFEKVSEEKLSFEPNSGLTISPKTFKVRVKSRI